MDHVITHSNENEVVAIQLMRLESSTELNYFVTFLFKIHRLCHTNNLFGRQNDASTSILL